VPIKETRNKKVNRNRNTYKETEPTRNKINQLGPETRYTHSDWNVGFFRSEQKFYTFKKAKAAGLVTEKYKKEYNKKLKRAKNKPEMFDPPGVTLRQIKSKLKRTNWKIAK